MPSFTLPRIFALCMIITVLAGCKGHSGQQAEACLKLKDLALKDVQIVAADYNAEGHDVSLKTAPLGLPLFKVPASCRLKLVISPTPDSHIVSEVWMPAPGWNGKLWSGGNGGLAGSIDELSMTVALMRGYATSGTDTGHNANEGDGSWALGHPEKLIDFGHRAIHETAVQAKALIKEYYGKAAAYSYFSSGSNGGREALAEAQRYPDDYDGIESGAPAFNGSNNVLGGSWISSQLLKTDASWFSAAKLPAIAAASMAACDAIDGLKDGLIDDPRLCHPQAAALLCKGAETDSCLTAPQVASLEALYSGPGGKDPDQFGYYGYEPGGELDWKDWQLGGAPRKSVMYLFSEQFHRYLVYGDASWTFDRFKLSEDEGPTDKQMAAFYDARDPDLSRFAAHGGKLILYHGWSDMALPPRLTIEYYERVQNRLGADAAAKFVLLYMVPGMGHVAGGSGPNAFGQFFAPSAAATPSSSIGRALEEWVEKGVKPSFVVAGKYDNDIKALVDYENMTPKRTRPLCPYPEVARWNGTGSSDDAKNFNCSAPST